MKKVLIGLIISFFAIGNSFASWTVDGKHELLERTITACTLTPAQVGQLAPITEGEMDTLCGAGWTINNGTAEDFQGVITTCTDMPVPNVGLYQFPTPEAHDMVCGENVNFGDSIETNLLAVVTAIFTSLGAIIISPLGGLIAFGLAVSYIFYVKRMAKVKNAGGRR